MCIHFSLAYFTPHSYFEIHSHNFVFHWYFFFRLSSSFCYHFSYIHSLIDENLGCVQVLYIIYDITMNNLIYGHILSFICANTYEWWMAPYPSQHLVESVILSENILIGVQRYLIAVCISLVINNLSILSCAYSPQKTTEIYFSEFWRLESLRLRCWQGRFHSQASILDL